jgi:hypothetical protein
VWADGSWKVPVHEHLRALRDSRFNGSVHVGIVGTPENREAAEHYFVKFWSPAVDWCAKADDGFEQVTLNALHEYVHEDDAARHVLYAHTKGAFQESVQRDLWRESMTAHLVRHGGDLAVPLLETYDAVGLHWLTPEEFPHRGITTPFFGGNFWWATAAYLRTLPRPGTSNRFDAEAWIGLGDPKVAVFQPGWPPYDTF